MAENQKALKGRQLRAGRGPGRGPGGSREACIPKATVGSLGSGCPAPGPRLRRLPGVMLPSCCYPKPEGVWCSHLFENFPQFIVIHTVKGFGIVNKAEVDGETVSDFILGPLIFLWVSDILSSLCPQNIP